MLHLATSMYAWLVPKADLPPGCYRRPTGKESVPDSTQYCLQCRPYIPPPPTSPHPWVLILSMIFHFHLSRPLTPSLLALESAARTCGSPRPGQLFHRFGGVLFRPEYSKVALGAAVSPACPKFDPAHSWMQPPAGTGRARLPQPLEYSPLDHALHGRSQGIWK